MAHAGGGASTDVVFVVMPFADTSRPAIGVGLLQAAARAAGYSAVTEYCNIAFAERIGGPLYRRISFGTPPKLLVGEWLFAAAAFAGDIATQDDYLEHVLAPHVSGFVLERIAGARAHHTQFVDECVERIMSRRPRVVGLTTMFHQTCASLAVARRLKALPDPPIVVFGGPNCESEMGLQMIEAFPWIDAVCHGEADRSFLRLLEVLLRNASGPIGGVSMRGDRLQERPSLGVQDMDALPIPDYDDYFEQLDAVADRDEVGAHLVVETSRGCWWGAKHHCTFCGLNGETMGYRSKSPERAFREIAYLVERHGLRRVASVDNILDMRYLDTLMPRLADSDLELELFYEVKANLRYEQLQKMRAAGIRDIQPGIESFSTPVLRLMDKGVTGLQNVQLLRWCDELGIVPSWNILAGFPGEPQSEYERMARLVPLLAHLRPPASTARLRLDRFSPFHARSDEYGFRNVRAAEAYSYVFPVGQRELDRLAYYFDYDYDDGRAPERYLQPVRRAVLAWWRGHRAKPAPRLDAQMVDQTLVITDTRPVAVRPRYELTGVSARVCILCDSTKTLAALLRDPQLADREDEVRATIDELLANRLLVRDGDRYLSLAVIRNRSSLTDNGQRAATPSAATPSAAS